MATPAFVEHGGLHGPAEKGGEGHCWGAGPVVTEGMAGSTAPM